MSIEQRDRRRRGLGVLSGPWAKARALHGMGGNAIVDAAIRMATTIALYCVEYEVERGASAYALRRKLVEALYCYFSPIGPDDAEQREAFERSTRPSLIKEFNRAVSELWDTHRVMVLGLSQMELLRQSRAAWFGLFFGVPLVTIYFLASFGAWLASFVR